MLLLLKFACLVVSCGNGWLYASVGKECADLCLITERWVQIQGLIAWTIEIDKTIFHSFSLGASNLNLHSQQHWWIHFRVAKTSRCQQINKQNSCDHNLIVAYRYDDDMHNYNSITLITIVSLLARSAFRVPIYQIFAKV